MSSSSSPPSSAEAWIFDLDETLVRSAHLWREAVDAVARTLGGELTSALWTGCKGRDPRQIASLLCERLAPGADADEVFRDLRGRLLERWRTRPMEAVPGIPGLLERLGTSVKLAVASGSPGEAIDLALAGVGLAGRFPVRVSTEDVPRGKPEPDVYLEAARRLGVSPDRSIAAEDSPTGARAALAAGMTCVVVPSVRPDDFPALPVILHRSWDDVDPGRIVPAPSKNEEPLP